MAFVCIYSLPYILQPPQGQNPSHQQRAGSRLQPCFLSVSVCGYKEIPGKWKKQLRESVRYFLFNTESVWVQGSPTAVKKQLRESVRCFLFNTESVRVQGSPTAVKKQLRESVRCLPVRSNTESVRVQGSYKVAVESLTQKACLHACEDPRQP